ncbi:helix-turn-helix domain-containing protein [Curtobacterium sp. SL109]|uniref:helix-turn-helix domain-containing protein n=1 Tax=Curtobacterium sp. SL109 TaxID=2994662 RepID=UPI002274FC90|nr:helix-turn-helix transcriptional regulator [Curtobacterium sp. SL109]MCY1692842.1 helix-turn-helix transcriptional regulator [Curtobacterium sp. SL109]
MDQDHRPASDGSEHSTEISDFLQSRRARITPERAGIVGGGRRRVPGLRREELAMLAGVSSDYYAKMERGHLAGVSDEVLDALARALQLDEAETDHLFDLARADSPVPVRRRTPKSTDHVVRPSLQRFLDTITGTPTIVQNRRSDVIATNALGRALLSPLLDDPANQGNNARFTFLSPASRNFYVDWEQGASSLVASMRSHAGKNPHDRDLTDLVGELVTRSDDFRRRWAAHDVHFHRSGTKRLHHPAVGDVEVAFEAMQLPDSPGWTMYGYTTVPGSPSDERVRLLGSIAASEAAAAIGATTDTTGTV